MNVSIEICHRHWAQTHTHTHTHSWWKAVRPSGTFMTHALNYYSDFVLKGNQYIIQLHFGTERERERTNFCSASNEALDMNNNTHIHIYIYIYIYVYIYSLMFQNFHSRVYTLLITCVEDKSRWVQPTNQASHLYLFRTSRYKWITQQHTATLTKQTDGTVTKWLTRSTKHILINSAKAVWTISADTDHQYINPDTAT